MVPTYIKPERLSLRLHPELNEKWVQDLIATDPSVLGIGDLVLRDKERIQPRAGRLDLLLQDPETKRRYEVEVQLGSTDEAHIIRAIEYWDIERKRYPQYDHCAVLIAEDITSRFLNVISLFNGSIPLIAIQMQALKVGDAITLVFTKVLDELTRGVVDEDEDAEAAPTDRTYWETRATKQTLGLTDEMLKVVRTYDQSLELKYNKFYIGLARHGQPFNFALFSPRKKNVLLEVRLPRTDETDLKIENTGIEMLGYSKWGAYRFNIDKEAFEKHRDLLRELFGQAYQERAA